MEIERIEIGLPTSPVSNADVIELVNECSKGITESILVEVKQFFQASGANQRFWRNNNRDPRDILRDTTRQLLSRINKKEIKVVIFCSATKYFADPAHASVFCAINNISPRAAFDVSDGCMGWLTALYILNASFGLDCHGYGLIVSHEFPMGAEGAIYPKSFSINNEAELKYKLPALTLGEACTLTLVNLHSRSTLIERIEISEAAPLCTLPFRNYEDFMFETPFITEAEKFHAHYQEMPRVAAIKSVSTLNKLIQERDVNLVPHSYTDTFGRLTKHLHFNTTLVNYFSEYGNTATSSIPLNLAVSSMRKNLDLAKPTYAWCASAGIKIGVARIKLSPTFNL